MENIHADKLRRYRWAVGINSALWAAQICIFVLLANSISLLGDAMHSVADTLVLLSALAIQFLSLRNAGKDYGRIRKVLARAAVFLLWGSAIYIVMEGIERIGHPIPFSGLPVAIAAFISAVGNFFSYRIMHGVHNDLHDSLHHASVLHILTDFSFSFIVFVSALGVIVFDAPAIDGYCAPIVALIMSWVGWTIFRDTGDSGDAHGHHHH